MNTRHEQMLAMYNEGKTFAEIGVIFGISRQRVHQILGSQYQKRNTGHIQRQIIEMFHRHNQWMTARAIAKGYTHESTIYNALNALVKVGIVERRKSAMHLRLFVYRLKSED